MQDRSDITMAAAKASPPLTVTGITVAGIPLSDWVLIATLVYTAMQIAALIRNLLRQKKRQADCPPDCPAACPSESAE